MILSVHAIFGAAAASLVPEHPVAGFAIGFASHFILDAIPHKDYKLISLEKDSANRPQLMSDALVKLRLIRDMFLVSLDAILGLALAFMFFFDPFHPWVFLLGALGSLLPDFLTFLYIFSKHKSLDLFTALHVDFIHSKRELPVNEPVGVLLQFCTMGFLTLLIFWF